MPDRQKRDDQTAKEYFLEQCAAYYDELKSTAQRACRNLGNMGNFFTEVGEFRFILFTHPRFLDDRLLRQAA